jgi:guanylate kinase
MSQFKVLAIMGKAGSGKDTIAKELIKCFPDRFERVVSATTRPPREGEINGVDYHFLTPAEFLSELDNNRMLEATCFNDWAYGTPITSLSETKINVLVLNPEGVNILGWDKRIDLKVAYIIASDKERLLRQLSREDNPDVDEIIRRFGTDRTDFLEAESNPDFPTATKFNNNTRWEFSDTIRQIAYDFCGQNWTI